MKPLTNMTNTKVIQSKVDAIVEIIHMIKQVGCLNTMNITVNDSSDSSDNVHVSFSKYGSDREYEGFVFNKHIHSNYNFLTYKGVTHKFTKCEMILLNTLITTRCERSVLNNN